MFQINHASLVGAAKTRMEHTLKVLSIVMGLEHSLLILNNLRLHIKIATLQSGV